MPKRITLLLLSMAMGCSNGLFAAEGAKADAVPAAAAVDGPGEPVLEEPTLHCLGAYWIVAGDEQKQFRIDMAYRRPGARQWRQSMPMFRVRKGDTTQNNAHQAQLNPAADAWLFAGSFVTLAPDTEYELKLTLVKPAGPPLERLLRTAQPPSPSNPADLRVCHMAPGNGGGDGSQQSPYRGLKFARARPARARCCWCTRAFTRARSWWTAAARRAGRSCGGGPATERRSSTPTAATASRSKRCMMSASRGFPCGTLIWAWRCWTPRGSSSAAAE